MDSKAKQQLKTTTRPASERRALEQEDSNIRGQSFYFEVLELKAAPVGAVLAESGGLRGRKQANESISFRYSYRSPVTGKARDIDCGTWPEIGIREIRKNRDEFKRQIAEGIDPREVEKQNKAAAPIAAKIARVKLEEELAEIEAKQAAEAALDPTLEALFKDWIKRGVKRANDNSSLKSLFNKHILPAVGSLPVRGQLKEPIADLLRGVVADHGMNRTAVVIKNDLAQMFKWADDERPWRQLLAEHGVPTRRIDMNLILDNDYEEERDRVLLDDEIVELDSIFRAMTLEYDNTPAGQRYGVVRPLPPAHQLAVWICLSTMSRIGELTQSRWQYIDFSKSPVEYLIPMSQVKGKRGKKQDHMMFLSPFAERCIRRLHELTSHTPWLFPSDLGDGPIGPKTMTKSIGDRQIMFRKQVTGKPRSRRQENNTLVLADGVNGNWTPHDLRRTGATMMARLGVDPALIDRCQNHVVDDGKNKVRRHYQWYQYQDEKAAAWAALGAELERILGIPSEPTCKL